VPLVIRNHDITPSMVTDYAIRINAKPNKLMTLSEWNSNLCLEDELNIDLCSRYIGIKKEKKDPAKQSKKGCEEPICLSDEKVSLSGYSLKTKFGIGHRDGDQVVPDAPYCIELYDPDNKLCLMVGFWYKYDAAIDKDTMIISQIQQPVGSVIPGKDLGAQLGIVGMEIARLVAKEMKFDEMATYSGKTHPMFQQYPERAAQFRGDFISYYDASAKALGFTGSRSTSYIKDLLC